MKEGLNFSPSFYIEGELYFQVQQKYK